MSNLAIRSDRSTVMSESRCRRDACTMTEKKCCPASSSSSRTKCSSRNWRIRETISVRVQSGSLLINDDTFNLLCSSRLVISRHTDPFEVLFSCNSFAQISVESIFSFHRRGIFNGKIISTCSPSSDSLEEFVI